MTACTANETEAQSKKAYRRRHRVENGWARLKKWRAVATRYEKTATSYMAVLRLAAAVDWTRNGS